MKIPRQQVDGHGRTAPAGRVRPGRGRSLAEPEIDVLSEQGGDLVPFWDQAEPGRTGSEDRQMDGALTQPRTAAQIEAADLERYRTEQAIRNQEAGAEAVDELVELIQGQGTVEFKVLGRRLFDAAVACYRAAGDFDVEVEDYRIISTSLNEGRIVLSLNVQGEVL